MTTTPQSMSDLPISLAELGAACDAYAKESRDQCGVSEYFPDAMEAALRAFILCRATAEQAGNYGHSAGCTSASADHPYSPVLSCCLGAEQAGKVEGWKDEEAQIDAALAASLDGHAAVDLLRGDDECQRHGMRIALRAVPAKPTQPAATQMPVYFQYGYKDHFDGGAVYVCKAGSDAAAAIDPSRHWSRPLIYGDAAPVSPSREVEAHGYALDAIYGYLCAGDNQDIPLEEWPAKIVAWLAEAGWAVVPTQLPFAVLGEAAQAGVFETGNPKHGWDYLLAKTRVYGLAPVQEKAP